MEIKNEERHHAGIFYIDDNGNRLGEMRYLTRDNVMNIYHTEVSEKLKGQHMGEKLVEAGVNFARENHLKILPTCVFARSVFNRVKAYGDVLAEI
ncbi:GNAT family N-acetyltransferase [Mucilaginibacter sp. McL0603]|uniref:GNAT family N-acetyltransferase n=1 Tax=Mucilaginibacter sp. McL0603 TaxID=3415670 RepID=UPI003CFAA152